MASATGCSDCASTAAIRARVPERSKPCVVIKSVSVGWPSVTVPVLSSAMISTSLRCCSASPLRNNTPISAARPVPTIIEVGVAKPIAQGHAIIRTDTPATNAKVRAGSGPIKSQTITVSSASARTAGTNHMVTRSTKPWMGNFAPCASSTMRMICARVVSAPTRVAAKVRLPVPLTVPPVTKSSALFGTASGSPVIMLSSTLLLPSVTAPSTGIRSPGRTRTRSPIASLSMSTSTVSPSRKTRAVFACNPKSA